VRILVVDDSPAIRSRLVAMLVEVPGVEASEAAGADEALALVVASAPDFVVLDLHMPGKGGLEILPALKRRSPSPTVVVLTSHPTDQHRRLSLASGADFFFDKSREFSRVVELVREALR
jgi:two-component system, NarL family, response regulator DevR